MRTFRILSIDGGGIRGIIPAVILRKIEANLRRPIHELFDLIVGTSTGGIIALGLTTPRDSLRVPKFSAADLVDFYWKEGPKIFDPDRRTGMLKRTYPIAPLETALEYYFGKARLKHSLQDVLVTSYHLVQRRPFMFRSREACLKDTDDYFCKDVARAATAAPTYFDPARIFPADYQNELIFAKPLIDGGVYVNNPAVAGLVEAIRAHTQPGASWPHFVLVSLGTGSLVRQFAYDEAVKWTVIGWARRILDIVLDGQSDHTDEQLAAILGQHSPLGTFFRFQSRLVKAKDDLDDASERNLERLVGTADTILDSEHVEFDRLLSLLGEERNDPSVSEA